MQLMHHGLVHSIVGHHGTPVLRYVDDRSQVTHFLSLSRLNRHWFLNAIFVHYLQKNNSNKYKNKKDTNHQFFQSLHCSLKHEIYKFPWQYAPSQTVFLCKMSTGKAEDMSGSKKFLDKGKKWTKSHECVGVVLVIEEKNVVTTNYPSDWLIQNRLYCSQILRPWCMIRTLDLSVDLTSPDFTRKLQTKNSVTRSKLAVHNQTKDQI